MKKRKMRELLDQHARAMMLGTREDESLLAQNPDDSEELNSLFQLARSIKGALVPVKASESFKLELKQELGSISPDEFAIDDSTNKQKRWLVVAAAGSAISVLGIVLYVLRRIRSASQAAQPATTAA